MASNLDSIWLSDLFPTNLFKVLVSFPSLKNITVGVPSTLNSSKNLLASSLFKSEIFKEKAFKSYFSNTFSNFGEKAVQFEHPVCTTSNMKVSSLSNFWFKV